MTKITTDAQPLLSPTELEIARIIQLGFNKWPRTSAVEMAKAIAARLASTSPAPDGWVLVGYGMRSNVDGSIAREFVPAGWRTTTELLEKFHQEPWVVNGRASIVSFYAAPQPVVEKDNG